jgi:propionyl-CoA carboxylase alpha chain
VDKNLGFYFLEMNTRLQVEHPITEQITGIDLVEEMIKIAAGHKLSFTQDDIKINGHAIEYRVYAEDPARKFLPSIGFLRNYHEPEMHDQIRIDTGVEEGSEISMYYDPMISKTITWAPKREEAMELLKKALKEYVIQGVTDNTGFGLSILNHPAFIAGKYDTSFIPKYYPTGYHGDKKTEDEKIIVAITTARLKNIHRHEASNSETEAKDLNTVYVNIEDQDYRVDICHKSQTYTVHVVGTEKKSVISMHDFTYRYNSLVKFNSTKDNTTQHNILQLYGITNQLGYNWLYNGTIIKAKGYSPRQFALKGFMAPPKVIDYGKYVMSPMPGAIVSVSVNSGDIVEDGQNLLVIEAMKMQNLIKSERSGKIKKVKVKPGDSVAVDAILIEYE